MNNTENACLPGNVKTFQDFLIYYNLKEVTGFLHAINKQRDFFRARGMTFLEDALSPPGLSLEQCCFNSKIRTLCFCFVLFSNKHADLHTRIKQNIVGSPSIVWNRLAVKNQTKIRPHDYPCLLYTSPSPRDVHKSRMPSSA